MAKARIELKTGVSIEFAVPSNTPGQLREYLDRIMDAPGSWMEINGAGDDEPLRFPKSQIKSISYS